MTDETHPRLLEDPLIHRIPGEWPQAFLRLPWSEQRWRGRLYLVTYVLVSGARSGGLSAYAWSVAMNQDPRVCAENRAFVEDLGDDVIVEGLDNLA